MSNPPLTDATLEALEALFTGFGDVYELLPCPPANVGVGPQTVSELLASIEQLESELDNG